ncbi:MAG: magnesium transporter [Eubacteriales bacterium]|nr:magnesium transporter [Eubacteriales bacterium]
MDKELMTREEYWDYLRDLLKERRYLKLRHELVDDNEVDIANFIEELHEDEAAVVFRMLPKQLGAEVFAHLEPSSQRNLAKAFSDREVADMLDKLFVDDAVDFLEEMPASVVKRLLAITDSEKRQLINHFLQYPEDSAGSIMTAEFTDLKKNMTVGQAIEHLRKHGEDRETIYTCYVTNAQRILEGVVSVKALLLADDDELIGDLMETDIVKANTLDDQENVANLFHTYDFLAIPVVDNENRLVGIVTVDDAVDIMQEEVTEDFEKMAAMMPSERPYLKTSTFSHAKSRIPWLLILMISAMVNGHILERYEQAFVALPALVFFIPMLTDTGGNVGSQTSTMMIRGMTLREIGFGDIFRVLWKETRVSMIMGLVLAVINFIRIYISYDFTIAMTVSVALFVTVFMSAAIGGILPLVASRLKLDPAIMAAPLITTIVDAGALVIYFATAHLLLSTFGVPGV